MNVDDGPRFAAVAFFHNDVHAGCEFVLVELVLGFVVKVKVLVVGVLGVYSAAMFSHPAVEGFAAGGAEILGVVFFLADYSVELNLRVRGNYLPYFSPPFQRRGKRPCKAV